MIFWMVIGVSAFPLVMPWGRALLFSVLGTWLALWFAMFYVMKFAPNLEGTGLDGIEMLFPILIPVLVVSLLLRLVVRGVAQWWRHKRRHTIREQDDEKPVKSGRG